MKRLLSVLTLMLSLAACGGGATPDEEMGLDQSRLLTDHPDHRTSHCPSWLIPDGGVTTEPLVCGIGEIAYCGQCIWVGTH